MSDPDKRVEIKGSIYDKIEEKMLRQRRNEIIRECCLAVCDFITNVIHNGDPMIEQIVSEKDRRLIRLVTGRLPCTLTYNSFLQARDFCSQNRRGQSLLHCTVETGQIELAKWFLENGVKVDEANEFGLQPIHRAALSHHPMNNEFVNLFLDYGANVNARHEGTAQYTASWVTPLHLAVTKENEEVVKTLLKRGADTTLKTKEGGCTALHTAAVQPDDRFIRILLSAGADILAEDNEGSTPFAEYLIRSSSAFFYRIHRNMMPGPILPMVRVLAVKKISQPLIEIKDERLYLSKRPIIWSYYQDFCAEVWKMKHIEFFKGCTFMDLLAKKPSQIALLMQNPAFEANLQLYDLSRFSMYAEDIREAIERVRNHYHFMLELEVVINEAVHYILPDLVVRKVVSYV